MKPGNSSEEIKAQKNLSREQRPLEPACDHECQELFVSLVTGFKAFKLVSGSSFLRHLSKAKIPSVRQDTKKISAGTPGLVLHLGTIARGMSS